MMTVINYIAAAIIATLSPTTSEPAPPAEHGVMDWSTVGGSATGVDPNKTCAMLLAYQSGTDDDDNLTTTVAINTHSVAYPDLSAIDRSYMVGLFVGCLATDEIGEPAA